MDCMFLEATYYIIFCPDLGLLVKSFFDYGLILIDPYLSYFDYSTIFY